MKKIILLFFMGLIIVFSNQPVKAATSHENFEELNLVSGKLISEYSAKELDSHYKSVKKSKFSGWRVSEVNKRVKASFVSETLFSYYNDGYTAIDYNYKSDEQTTSKYSFSATGSIAVTSTKTKTGFKNGLDGSLKMSYSTEKQTQKKETIEMKMKIDPGTQVVLYVYGEGRLTNGVAARYLLWFRTNLGGYEVFEVATQYNKLEKIRI